MATKVECFRVEFLFDVICPHSWIGYKMLQSRRTRWEKANIHVEFIPVRRRKLLTLSKVETLLSMVPTKQQYIFHELKSLARQYHIEINRPECLGEFLEGAGSGNALLLLNLIRRERPAFYERAMEKTWTRIWSQNKPTHRAPHFFALCREIGFEFRDCDDLVSRIQLQSNANDVMQATKCAAEAGVFDTPWLRVKCGTCSSLGFHGVFSLNLVDFVLSRRDVFEKWAALEEMHETPVDGIYMQTCCERISNSSI
uniref:DSBA-like thioredoxin domain-containing protein n=3 Tax=Parascaris univalens TaxID=6257 RepID=A0A915BVA3_PARUN